MIPIPIFELNRGCHSAWGKLRDRPRFVFPSCNQQVATFLDLFISTDAPHVSGSSFPHHQEHKTVQTASGVVNQYCCLLARVDSS